MTRPGQFSPIEDLIREAEQRAQREWDREHQPCPHESVVYSLERRWPFCVSCGAEVDDNE